MIGTLAPPSSHILPAGADPVRSGPRQPTGPDQQDKAMPSMAGLLFQPVRNLAFASFTSHSPTTADMNTGWWRYPSDA